MKTKLNHIGIIKQSLGWLAVFAGAGLAVGALNYRDIEQKIALGEKNSEVAQAMVHAAHLDALLRQLGEGQTDVARQQLSCELAYNLSVVKASAASSDEWTQDFARQLVMQIGRDEKKHPDYYLASTRLSSLESGEVMQVVRH